MCIPERRRTRLLIEILAEPLAVSGCRESSAAVGFPEVAGDAPRQERLEEARAQVAAFHAEEGVAKLFENEDAAARWLRRVEIWERSLTDDLAADSVPSPGDADLSLWVRW